MQAIICAFNDQGVSCTPGRTFTPLDSVQDFIAEIQGLQDLY